MRLYGGGLVVKTLKHFGVRRLFALPGHQILSVFDACLEEGLDLISTRHEASAAFMAQALSYANREPGVVLLAGGPEVTNALTGIAQAYYAGAPLLVISGSNTPKKRDRGFPQDMNQLEIVRPFTKWARCCYDVRRIPEYIATAYRHAIRCRPAPVYIEIPYDILEEKVGDGSVHLPDKPLMIRPGTNRASLVELIDLLEKAKKPIAIAGSGALWSDAEDMLLRFSERTGIPLLLTTGAMAMPFPPGHVFGWGSMGAGRSSLEAISRADLILLFGTKVNFLLGFGQPPFLSSKQKLVQVDIHAEEMDTNRRLDLGISGDLRTVLETLDGMDLSFPNWENWKHSLEKSRHSFQESLKTLTESSNSPVHPLRLAAELESLRMEDSFLVLDGANSILWAIMAARPRSQGGILISTLGELEAIGAGVPQALAVKRDHPERQVILHTGDGSFGYGFMEMETAVRYGIPLVVVVHNDQGWGMTRDMQTEYFGEGREIGNRLGLVRYDKLVEALGGHGEFVEHPDELKPALERALNAGKAACVNVLVDPKPQSPGLKMFMLMEVMLGKTTYYDKVPDTMRKLKKFGLEGFGTQSMLRYLDRMLHKDMG